MGKVCRVKQRTKVRRKKRFGGNQFTIEKQTPTRDPALTKAVPDIAAVTQLSPVHSASASKVEDINTNTPNQKDSNITGYRFVDVEILTEIIQLLCCPACKSESRTLKLHENFSKKMGLSSMLVLKCISRLCDFKKEFYTSRDCGRSFDINRRVIYSMRSCGQGFSSIEKFTTLMNMPTPMTKKKL